MFKTRDGLVQIDVIEDLSEVVFPPADFSIMNIPHDHEDAIDLFKNLYNTPTSRHVSLVFCRHKKNDRIRAMSNFENLEDWSYLDSVHVVYEKASSGSNNSFLPLSEQRILLYKGQVPDVGQTSWFSEEGKYSNATTFWWVATQPDESEILPSSYYQRFNWEIAMLMYSLAKPMEHGRFIYGFPPASDAESIFSFCKTKGISVQLYVKSIKEANELFSKYKET